MFNSLFRKKLFNKLQLISDYKSQSNTNFKMIHLNLRFEWNIFAHFSYNNRSCNRIFSRIDFLYVLRNNWASFYSPFLSLSILKLCDCNNNYYSAGNCCTYDKSNEDYWKSVNISTDTKSNIIGKVSFQILIWWNIDQGSITMRQDNIVKVLFGYLSEIALSSCILHHFIRRSITRFWSEKSKRM